MNEFLCATRAGKISLHITHTRSMTCRTPVKAGHDDEGHGNGSKGHSLSRTRQRRAARAGARLILCQQCFINERDRIRANAHFAAKGIVERGDKEEHDTENGREDRSEDHMHMYLHVLYSNQDDVHQRAKRYHPPKDGGQARCDIGKA
jgi:hypothetical protein